MARKQAEVRIFSNNKNRSGSISRRMLFIWCMMASLIMYLTPQNFSNKFQFAFAHVFRYPLNVGDNVSLSARTQQQLSDVVPREQYIELENNYANLKQTIKEQREEFQQLDGLRNTFINQDVDFILGKIINATENRSLNELTIECRGIQGLAKGQFVLARDNSIIGRITDISPQLKKAKVKLITASDSQIAVHVEGLSKYSLMQGSGDNTAKIGLIPIHEKIKIGQKVFAINFEIGEQVFDINKGSFIDSPMIVGRISDFKEDDNQPLIWDITVKPSWDIKQLDKVAIIVMNQTKP